MPSLLRRFTDRYNDLPSALRTLVCLGLALVIAGAAIVYQTGLLSAVMIGWDSFCLLMLVFSWTTFYTLPQPVLQEKAQQEDESRSATFVLVLCSVSISLVGILLLLRTQDTALITRSIHRTVSLLGVALSWGLLHTIFTLRYAHLYYTDDTGGTKKNGGLDFPSDGHPDYLDFAYFSFVVGMTFQVSDVVITSRRIRRVVLLHGFIAFVFNTAIVALSISVISNFGK